MAMANKKELREQLKAADDSAALTLLIATLEELDADVTLGDVLDAAPDSVAARITGLRCVALAALLSGEEPGDLYVAPKKRGRRRQAPPRVDPKPDSQGSLPGTDGNGRDPDPPATPEEVKAALVEATQVVDSDTGEVLEAGCESLDEAVLRTIVKSKDPLGGKAIRDTMIEQWGLEVTDGEFRRAIDRLKKAVQIEQKGKHRGTTYVVAEAAPEGAEE